MQGQNLTLKPFLYIKSSSSYSLHSLHTKNLPQITQIHTDFSFLKNICEYLWNLWEYIHILLERYSPTDYADSHRF